MRTPLTISMLTVALLLTGCGDADPSTPNASNEPADAPVQGADLGVAKPKQVDTSELDALIAVLEMRVESPLKGDDTKKIQEFLNRLIADRDAVRESGEPMPADARKALLAASEQLLSNTKAGGGSAATDSVASAKPRPEAELNAAIAVIRQHLSKPGVPYAEEGKRLLEDLMAARATGTIPQELRDRTAALSTKILAESDSVTVARSVNPDDIAATQKANAEAFLNNKKKPGKDTGSETTEPDKADKKSRYDSPPLNLNPDDPNAGVRMEDLPALQAPTVDGYKQIDFDLLSNFEYVVDEMIPSEEDAAADPDLTIPEKRGDDQVPATVKALDGKKIAIAGYMVPVSYRDGKTNEFVLIKVVPSCFFCQQPGINDWVEVKTGDKWVPYMGDDPLYVTGVLHVGAIKEDGFTLSLYRMDAHGVEPLKIEEK